MEICFTFGGLRHCFHIPVLRNPWGPLPGPGPVDYPLLMSDATLVATIHEFSNSVSDSKVKSALQSGVQNAVKAMQDHIGKDAQIQLQQQQG